MVLAKMWHRTLEGLVARLRRPLVDAEEAVVLAGKGAAEGVLQQARGADDDRRLAEIFEHQLELLGDLLGEGAGEHALAQFGRLFEIALRPFVGHEQLPPSVLDDVGIEHVRADVEGIAVFEHFVPATGRVVDEDLAGEQQAHRLAADEPRTDEPRLDAQEVAQRQVFADEPEELLVAGEQQAAELFDHILLFLDQGVRGVQVAGTEKEVVPVVQVPRRLARWGKNMVGE
jgi:hypothetical protein